MRPIGQSSFCTPDNPHYSIRKLVRLMRDPMTRSFTDRHIEILDDFIQACCCAFWVQDLPFVIQLLELIIDNPENMVAFNKHLECLLKFCAVPPMLKCSSEILESMEDLQQYFSFFGYMLVSLKNVEFRNMVIDALRCLLSPKNKGLECSVSYSVRRQAAEESQLAEIVGQLMEIADEPLYEQLLKLCIILAEKSSITCQILVNQGAIRYIILRLDPQWQTRNIVDLPEDLSPQAVIQNFNDSCMLLWQLLESIKDCASMIKAKSKIPDVQGLWSLLYALRILVYRKGAELDRNSLLAILLQCMCLFPNLAFIQSGLAHDIALLCINTELGTQGTWAAEVRFTTSDIDYEFKKMLLFAMCDSRNCFGMADVYHNYQVIKALVRLITTGESLPWSLQQQCRLNLLALQTLQMLTPYTKRDIVENNVSEKVLSIVQNFIAESYDRDLLIVSLQLMYALVTSKEEEILIFMKENNAISILTDLCTVILDLGSLKMQDQRCLALAFHILQKLYQYLRSPQLSSVDLVIRYMERVLKPSELDLITDPTVIISMLDFLWESVVWYDDNLKEFVSKGGVYKILDITQICSFPIKLVTLSILVDLTEQGSCIPHLITWRGKGIKFMQMLLKIFREESRRLGVKMTADGAIKDIEAPLMGEQQWYETYCIKKDPDSSPATADLFGSSRPKIYALIQLLINRHKERVELANDCYQLANDKLRIADQVTMLVVENFLALKLLEVWVEVDKDIKDTGFRPISSDAQLLQTLCHRFYQWALNIQLLQNELIKKQKKNAEMEEHELYQILTESRLCDSLCALQQMCYIARTTEQMFRLTAKMRQKRQVEESLECSGVVPHRHRTFMAKLATTAVLRQTVTTQSNSAVSQPVQEEIKLEPIESVIINEKLRSLSTIFEDNGESLM